MALSGQDEECLRIMADVFERFRSGFMTNIYWEDLDHDSYKTMPKDDEHDDMCTIM